MICKVLQTVAVFAALFASAVAVQFLTAFQELESIALGELRLPQGANPRPSMATVLSNTQVALTQRYPDYTFLIAAWGSVKGRPVPFGFVDDDYGGVASFEQAEFCKEMFHPITAFPCAVEGGAATWKDVAARGEHWDVLLLYWPKEETYNPFIEKWGNRILGSALCKEELVNADQFPLAWYGVRYLQTATTRDGFGGWPRALVLVATEGDITIAYPENYREIAFINVERREDSEGHTPELLVMVLPSAPSQTGTDTAYSHMEAAVEGIMQHVPYLTIFDQRGANRYLAHQLQKLMTEMYATQVISFAACVWNTPPASPSRGTASTPYESLDYASEYHFGALCKERNIPPGNFPCASTGGSAMWKNMHGKNTLILFWSNTESPMNAVLEAWAEAQDDLSFLSTSQIANAIFCSRYLVTWSKQGHFGGEPRAFLLVRTRELPSYGPDLVVAGGEGHIQPIIWGQDTFVVLPASTPPAPSPTMLKYLKTDITASLRFAHKQVPYSHPARHNRRLATIVKKSLDILYADLDLIFGMKVWDYGDDINQADSNLAWQVAWDCNNAGVPPDICSESGGATGVRGVQLNMISKNAMAFYWKNNVHDPLPSYSGSNQPAGLPAFHEHLRMEIFREQLYPHTQQQPLTVHQKVERVAEAVAHIFKCEAKAVLVTIHERGGLPGHSGIGHLINHARMEHAFLESFNCIIQIPAPPGQVESLAQRLAELIVLV